MEENEITKNYFQSQSEIFIDQCVCVAGVGGLQPKETAAMGTYQPSLHG